MKISVIMPVFNEKGTIEEVLRRIKNVKIKKEIIVVKVPIAYHGRPPKGGKKITWKDGLMALWTLLKYRFVD